jgi:hypothetical protein
MVRYRYWGYDGRASSRMFLKIEIEIECLLTAGKRSRKISPRKENYAPTRIRVAGPKPSSVAIRLRRTTERNGRINYNKVNC